MIRNYPFLSVVFIRKDSCCLSSLVKNYKRYGSMFGNMMPHLTIFYEVNVYGNSMIMCMHRFP